MISLKLFIPDVCSEFSSFHFKGYVENCSSEAVIYVTMYSIDQTMFSKDIDDNQTNAIFGHFGTKEHKPLKMCKYYASITSDFKLFFINNGNNIAMPDNFVVMLYDYNKIRFSQALTTPDKQNYFFKLQMYIEKDLLGKINKNNLKVQKTTINKWLSHSMFAQHIVRYVDLMKWLILGLMKNNKITITEANFFCAVLVDLLLGYFALSYFHHHKEGLSDILINSLEKLINPLHSLLKWLMGSPAGFKLNNAFNKMLGKYFSYHVHMWWRFLDVSGEKLDVMLYIYECVGYLGLTFQAAFIYDMLCIATLHSYCIYIYAAKLFNIQLSGLIALMRLFVGRKYNPLRDVIDSCEYTNQELFVGTVAFTILLLLLPTTALYYIAFTLFRILSLAVHHILAKTIYFIQTLPIYVIILWAVNSPKVAGNILVETVSEPNSWPLLLRAKILTKPLPSLIRNFKPPVEVLKSVEWNNLISNVLTGKQIT